MLSPELLTIKDGADIGIDSLYFCLPLLWRLLPYQTSPNDEQDDCQESQVFLILSRVFSLYIHTLNGRKELYSIEQGSHV